MFFSKRRPCGKSNCHNKGLDHLPRFEHQFCLPMYLHSAAPFSWLIDCCASWSLASGNQLAVLAGKGPRGWRIHHADVVAIQQDFWQLEVGAIQITDFLLALRKSYAKMPAATHNSVTFSRTISGG